MLTAVITAVLGLLEQILPAITSAGNVKVIDAVISTLTELLPFIVQEVQALAAPVKNIIDALSANPATTADQLAQLQALDQQVDTAFEAAAKDTDAGV